MKIYVIVFLLFLSQAVLSQQALLNNCQQTTLNLNINNSDTCFNPIIGDIIRNVYDTLYVDEPKIIRLSISKNINLDRIIKKMDFKNYEIEKLRIDRLMEVEIINLSTDILEIAPHPLISEQPMEDGTHTHWEWFIKSLKPGKICFYIKINVIINNKPKNEKVFKYNIISISNDTKIDMFKKFILIYWQWLIGTLFLPIILIIVKNKTNKK